VFERSTFHALNGLFKHCHNIRPFGIRLDENPHVGPVHKFECRPRHNTVAVVVHGHDAITLTNAQVKHVHLQKRCRHPRIVLFQKLTLQDIDSLRNRHAAAGITQDVVEILKFPALDDPTLGRRRLIALTMLKTGKTR